MINDIIQISKEAGEIIRESFGKEIQFEYKSNEFNLVTETDKKAEESIMNFIRKKYPSHNILAEESGEIKGSGEYTWVIDPLDGTTNFKHRFPIFAVSIGVMRKDEIIAGVVYDVMKDEIYSAEKSSGAFCNDDKIYANKNDNLSHALLVTGFPYDISENPHNALDIFVQLTKQARGIRRLGAASIDFCYVAKGVFDAFWEVHLHPWDICAGKIIVEEAGGIVTDFEGKPTNIFTPKVLCSNKFLHRKMIEEIGRVKS